MELQNNLTLQIYNDTQRIIYAYKYGDSYSKNKDYFDKFLYLKQGKLTVDGYSDEFSKLQDVG